MAHDLLSSGVARYGRVRCGAVWRGMVRQGRVRSGLVGRGVVW